MPQWDSGKNCSLTRRVEQIHGAHNKARSVWTAAGLAAEGRLLGQCFTKSSCRQVRLFQKPRIIECPELEQTHKDMSFWTCVHTHISARLCKLTFHIPCTCIPGKSCCLTGKWSNFLSQNGGSLGGTALEVRTTRSSTWDLIVKCI